MNALEIAVYAMVLALEPLPFDCIGERTDAVHCSNGLAAVQNDPDAIDFSSGVTVLKGPKGELRFSNGVEAFRDVAGWIRFSNGVAVRRFRDGFRFNNGYFCRQSAADQAACFKER